jgi:hypothetical protein
LTGKRFLCRPLVTTRADINSRLVHVPGLPSTGQVENGLLALADHLQSWATFEEHLQALESSGLTLTAREFGNALEVLQRAGVLWRDEDFLGALVRQSPRKPAVINRLVWCTRNRPEVLARSMHSFLSRGFDTHAQRIFVCDDSSRPDVAARTRSAALKAAADIDGPPDCCTYIGEAEKQRIMAALKETGASRGVAPRTIDFIFSSRPGAATSEGANRNFALLLTAGEAFHSTDDDTLAEMHGNNPGGLELSSAHTPTVTDYLATAEHNTAPPVLEIAILCEHGRYLGRGVGDILRELRGEEVVLSACSSTFSRALAASEGEVVVTSAGALGDSGLGNPRLIFHLDGERRRRYVEDVDTYAAVRLSRNVFRRAERPTLTNSPGLVTLNYAVDNREFVPPFFPFGRNSDGLLGVILRFCRPADTTMHLPFAVRHIPPETRAFSEADLHAFIPRVCDFMIHAAEAARTGPWVRSRHDRVSAMAAHYRSFSSLSPHDFDDAVRSTWMTFADQYIANMETRLDEFGHSPGPWTSDVEQYLENMLDFLGRREPLIPQEFTTMNSSMTVDDQREHFRSSLGLFAEALEAWDTLREIAQEESLLDNL